MIESEIADALALFWLGRGYRVHAEVEIEQGVRSDLVALNDDDGDVVIIETKTGFTLDLRLQCARRLPFGKAVFAGIPRRGRPIASKYLDHAQYGILEVGLGGEVLVTRSAPRLLSGVPEVDRCLGWQSGATVLSCVPANVWRPGTAGIPARKGERILTSYYRLVVEIHAFVWGLGRPAHPGEILDGVPATRSHWRLPVYGLRCLLDREDAFALDPDSGGWKATGEGVPLETFDATTEPNPEPAP